MRINLNCPFADKEKAKHLGARWDVARRVWYVVDPDDLRPFMQWLPKPSTGEAVVKCKTKKQRPQKKDRHAVKTTGGKFVPLCDCTSPPWEDCPHSESLAQKAMNEILYPFSDPPVLQK
jgi:hypothetical protein